MTDKELRRMSRSELLEMLLTQMEENEALKSRLEQAEAKLQDRVISIEESGSIAEAALKLNDVFQAAENAAQQYLENIQRVSGQQSEICREMQNQAERQATEIRLEAEEYSRKVHEKADAYWKEIVARAAKLLEDQDSLRKMILSAREVNIT